MSHLIFPQRGKNISCTNESDQTSDNTIMFLLSKHTGWPISDCV